MPAGFIELAIVILLATVLGVLARFFRQPLILAFIATGSIITYFGFFHLNDREMLKTFSDLGIMFLLFLVGLEIDLDSLKMIGRASIFIGALQIIFTFSIGFFISIALHFNHISSAYIALALTLSSTVIVVKLLSEKKDINSLYGKISTGVLLIQDLVAVAVLVILAGFKTEHGLVWSDLAFTALKGAVLIIAVLFVGRKLFPYLFDRISHSQELLFLVSISWVFLLAAIVSNPKVGFPIEISGLLAGLALANSSTNFQIFSKVKYLRDFFVLIFFVILGSSFILSSVSSIIIPVIIFSLFVLVGTPLIILIIMGTLGYRKKTSFLTGLNIAQVSEFSLVLAASGLQLGHINQNVVALITAVGIITIAVSTYYIIYSENIFEFFSPLLSIFEKKNLKEKYTSDGINHKPIILIGSHRLGQSISYNIPRDKLLIIDFDPQVIEELKRSGYEYLFGDSADEEIFERAHFEHAKLIISTVPDFKDNVRLLGRLNQLKKDGAGFKIIMRASSEDEMKELYRHNADYVIFPHFTSGQYVGRSIAVDPEMNILEELKNRDLKIIRRLDRAAHIYEE